MKKHLQAIRLSGFILMIPSVFLLIAGLYTPGLLPGAACALLTVSGLLIMVAGIVLVKIIGRD